MKTQSALSLLTIIGLVTAIPLRDHSVSRLLARQESDNFHQVNTPHSDAGHYLSSVLNIPRDEEVISQDDSNDVDDDAEDEVSDSLIYAAMRRNSAIMNDDSRSNQEFSVVKRQGGGDRNGGGGGDRNGGGGGDRNGGGRGGRNGGGGGGRNGSGGNGGRNDDRNDGLNNGEDFDDDRSN